MNLSGLESKELHMRQSILYTVGRICDEEAQKQQHGHHAHTRPAMSKKAMALLADLVYRQSEGFAVVMATELQFFARHANRKIIKSEDVTLCARKHPNLVTMLLPIKLLGRYFEKTKPIVDLLQTNLLQKYQRETLNSSSAPSNSFKKRRRNFADLDESH